MKKMPWSGFSLFFYLSTSLMKKLLSFQIQTVMAIMQATPSEEDCNELGLDESKCTTQGKPFKITRYISNPIMVWAAAVLIVSFYTLTSDPVS